MKKSVLISALVIGLLSWGVTAVAQEYRIGVVNANKIVEQSPQYDDVRKSLETEFKRRNEDLVSKQKQLKKLLKPSRLMRQRSLLNR